MALPDWMPQLASYAEPIAVYLATAYAEEAIDIITDCGAVMSSFQQGLGYATKPSKAAAGLWVGMFSKVRSIKKTKAHRTAAQALAEGDEQDFRGNLLADGLAKQAVTLVLPSKAEIGGVVAEMTRRVHLMTNLAKTLLPVSLCGLKGRPPTNTRARVERRRRSLTHSFEWCHRRCVWVCCDCAGSARTQQTSTKTCKGTSAATRAAGQAVKLGHMIWNTKLEGPIRGSGFLFCSRCGQYAQNRANGFRRTCLGTASGSFRQTKKLLVGRHPVRNQGFGKPSLLRVAVEAAKLEMVEDNLLVRGPQQVLAEVARQEQELQSEVMVAMAAGNELQEAEAQWIRAIEGDDNNLEHQMDFFGEI